MPQNAIKNLATFGCSFTKDNYQQTWADILKDRFGLNLINHAERGAGSSFVVKRLLTCDIDFESTAVVILWPGADRYDLWADETTPHLLNDKIYASWPDGKSPNFVDYHGNYRSDFGFNLNGSVPRGHKHQYYKFFYSAHQAIHDWFVDVITAQLYLGSKKAKFLMASVFPLTNPIHHHKGTGEIIREIYNKIDKSNFVTDSETEGFFNFCCNNNLPFQDSNHPSTKAHEIWVNRIVDSRFKDLL